MPSYNFFALLRRMKYISRWGLMRNTLPENVQEHSLSVAILAHSLAIIGNEQYGKSYDENRVCALALYHDAPEILTGDLPTPVKYHNPEIKSAYKDLEVVGANKLLSLLPGRLRKKYEIFLLPGDSPEHRLVRAADKLDAYIKCIEEFNTGNREFLKAEKQLLSTLRQMELEELDYFLENFLPPFRLTLDELD
jgi:5'-deoxynucleotidase